MDRAFSHACGGEREIMCYDDRSHEFDKRCKHRDGGEAESTNDTTSTTILVSLGSRRAHCHVANQGTVFVGKLFL